MGVKVALSVALSQSGHVHVPSVLARAQCKLLILRSVALVFGHHVSFVLRGRALARPAVLSELYLGCGCRGRPRSGTLGDLELGLRELTAYQDQFDHVRLFHQLGEHSGRHVSASGKRLFKAVGPDGPAGHCELVRLDRIHDRGHIRGAMLAVGLAGDLEDACTDLDRNDSDLTFKELSHDISPCVCHKVSTGHHCFRC